jgi:2-dehydropantoate 2-reductase
LLAEKQSMGTFSTADSCSAVATEARGNLHIPQIKTAETIGEIETADLVLVAVKLWDTEFSASLKPIAERGAAIISFQNGVQKDDVLRKYLPDPS